MPTYQDAYLAASGAHSQAKQEFERLQERMPERSADPVKTAIGLKRALFDELGFRYDYDSFTAQDVLRTRSANCLGLPLLIGALLEGQGIAPRYRVLINPKDCTYELEREFLVSTRADVSYGSPRLAEDAGDRMYRFTPLEHLVLEVDGASIETTSQEDDATDAECVRNISFEQALSFVYKDRAVNEMSAGRLIKAKELAEQALVAWNANRQVYPLLVDIARSTFDDELYLCAAQAFLDLRMSDSLGLFNRHLMSGEERDLDAALQAYPAYVNAMALRSANASDSMEARHGLAVASWCYAGSAVLDLGRFYVEFSPALRAFFGDEVVGRALRRFEDDGAGDFYYHMAMFNLTKDRGQLAECWEAVETPLQKLCFLAKSRGTGYFDGKALEILQEKHNGSRLFASASKDLKIAQNGSGIDIIR